jgi:hypothetical protein
MHRARTLAVGVVASLLAVVPAVDAKKDPKPPVVKKDAVYRGFTDQGSVCHVGGVDNRPCTVTVKTSKDGKSVARMLIRYGSACKDESKYFRSATRFTDVPIRNAKFESSAGYSEPILGGGQSDNEVTMHGVFKRKNGKRTVSGEFRITNKLSFPEGKPTKCGSGKVAWLAAPR